MINSLSLSLILLFSAITGVLVLAGVFVGAWIVYRTKLGASPVPSIQLRNPKNVPTEDPKPLKHQA